ncbi:S-adenosyl-L-methionine-dependent methyltransferase [Glomus cerebriforme]|uniref:S-adenosyl-L-methionine-dependent methyltransferase n=1 Tax=Glomus cerebriforme TaxID=658196 RepID=A0A397SKM4_9GLOM|nr:S-adenosyl-L-methionine-dependent methyltransferase [Glomus cerebriforme]
MGNFLTKKKSNNNNKYYKIIDSSKSQNLLESFEKLEYNENTNSRKSNYFMPDDDIETERLQQYHYMLKHLCDGNFRSPIHELFSSGSCKVLDLGCGPGTWVLDMGTSFYNNKKSEFIGIDFSPNFPIQIKPANTHFIQANILDGLPFEKDEIDFIHIGTLGSCFSESQWIDLVLPDIFRVMKSGSWIEFLEPNGNSTNCGPYYRKFYEAFEREMISLEVNPNIVTKYKDWFLSDSRFTNVHEEIRYLPIGSWDENNKLGKIGQENFHTFLKNMEHRLSKQLDVSLEEYDHLLSNLFQECYEYKTEIPFHCVYAQKR